MGSSSRSSALMSARADAIDRSGRPSVVAIFSDHGSGARFSATDQRPAVSDLDLRSANLLAVRGIGPLADDTTVVNLLPLIASRILGTPFEPQPDTVRVLHGDWTRPTIVDLGD